ncbi:TIGR04211 family SH3 domain-containing protein [Frischella perrara]|uniref:TIGR04211 family SH3 domain-containing protein n=1 Tax=Frischella perrara TaxID=1267021 RepID=UPI0023F009E3|nr:TIGR04211 family SH3 domain-containing protein [Frischella perrara]MCT6874661.1 TIGR04211 family SH3 domain-containing protein [Frischella perrara]
MSRKIILVIAISVIPFSFPVFADDKYITDNISVYLRRGPSTNYGLIGSLKSGDKVTIIDKSDDGSFTKIRDEKNRLAWIESELLTNTPSAKERLPLLEEQINTLNEKIINLDQEKQTLINDYNEQLKTAQSKISQLESSKNELEQDLNQKNLQIESLNKEIDENGQNLMLKWFTRGGMVAGAGLLLGLLLPFIFPRRRKKDRWLN